MGLSKRLLNCAISPQQDDASMAKHRKRWRQLTIRSVIVLTLFFATFAAGYRSGYEQSAEFLADTEFKRLIELIESTVVPDTWQALGSPHPLTLSGSWGCYVEVTDLASDQGESNWEEACNQRDDE